MRHIGTIDSLGITLPLIAPSGGGEGAMRGYVQVGAALVMEAAARDVMESRIIESGRMTDGVVVVGRKGAWKTDIIESGGMTDELAL